VTKIEKISFQDMFVIVIVDTLGLLARVMAFGGHLVNVVNDGEITNLPS